MQSKTVAVEFDIENYVEVADFYDLVKTGENAHLVAALTGCIEGIIVPGKENSFFTIAGLSKVKCRDSYLFLDIYRFVSKNRNMFNYIVDYFNLWHNNEYKVFSYDKYNKNDLINNFNELASLLIEERNIASLKNNEAVTEAYDIFNSSLSDLYMSSLK